MPSLAMEHVGPYADDGPEVSRLTIGIVAVASCAPIVVALEKGIYRRHGLEVTLIKEASWASCRDKLASGENHASHMKAVQPLGISLGAQGAAPTALIAPLTLSRGGSAFLIPRALAGQLTRDPATWSAYHKTLVAKGEALTIALPWFWGWHAMIWRHFLANGGINADREFKLVTMPPAQMVQNMRVGSMQACGMVEPWGVRGVSTKTANVLFYGHELWPDHPTKTLGMRADFAERNPRTVQALLRATLEAAHWCDKPENHPELARILAPATYINAPEAQISQALSGRLDWGDGRTSEDPRNAVSYARDTYPQKREFLWLLSALCRWGFLPMDLDFDQAVGQVLRPDLHDEAAKALGLPTGTQNDDPLMLWDGTRFEHSQAKAYTEAFEVHARRSAQ